MTGNNDASLPSNEDDQALWVTTTAVGAETAGEAARARLRRGSASRRAQNRGGQHGGKGDDEGEGGGGGDSPQEGEDGDGQEQLVQDVGSEADSEGGEFGSVGLLVFLVCFGMLFCVMEGAVSLLSFEGLSPYIARLYRLFSVRYFT